MRQFFFCVVFSLLFFFSFSLSRLWFHFLSFRLSFDVNRYWMEALYVRMAHEKNKKRASGKKRSGNKICSHARRALFHLKNVWNKVARRPNQFRLIRCWSRKIQLTNSCRRRRHEQQQKQQMNLFFYPLFSLFRDCAQHILGVNELHAAVNLPFVAVVTTKKTNHFNSPTINWTIFIRNTPKMKRNATAVSDQL